MKTQTLEVKRIHCKSCELLIEDSLKDLGVEKITFKKNWLTVSFDEERLTSNQIKSAIRNEGYQVD